MKPALAAGMAALLLGATFPLPDRGEGPPTRGTCTVEGYSNRLGRYLGIEVPCLQRPDGGIVLPQWPEHNRLPDFVRHNFESADFNPLGCDGGLCDSDEDGEGTPRTRPVALRCACRSALPDAGACRYLAADGGLRPVPPGETVGPGNPKAQWAGPGCVRRPCVELYGVPSTPSECE